jgi:hypothetical protein
MHISPGFDSWIGDIVNVSHVPCDFQSRLVDQDDFSPRLRHWFETRFARSLRGMTFAASGPPELGFRHGHAYCWRTDADRRVAQFWGAVWRRTYLDFMKIFRIDISSRQCGR